MSGPQVLLESSLPASLPAGTRTALYCSGRATWGNRPVAELALIVDGRPQAASWGMPRFDAPVRASGFWAVVDAHARPGREAIELEARVRGAGGEAARVALGRIAITEPLSAPPAPGARTIAVCMATFEPRADLFAAQVASLRGQTDDDWVCLISDDQSSAPAYDRLRALVADDDRFLVSRAPGRLGFYRNFERAVALGVERAPLIALCDQDDVWHPDKLAVLRASLGNARLAFSDQRLVDERGALLRETLWRGRSNNTTSLASMLIANTVTGAASLLPAEVVRRALPFPDSPGIEFHDHWIALVALASGELVYVDRPLYDYVQHPGAILGKVSDGGPSRQPRQRSLLRLSQWRTAYFLGYVPGAVRARTLLARCDEQLSPSKRRALTLYLAAERSWWALAWLALRPIRQLAGRTETLGEEWALVPGLLWRRLAEAVAHIPGWPQRLLLDTRFPDPPRFEQRRLRRWRERM